MTLPNLYFEDMTYTGVLATIFTGIEPAVALSLACVPFLRPLIKGNTVSTGTDSSYARRTIRSKGQSGSASRPFKELNDDSSEVQLQPLGSESLRYEAEAGREHTPPGGKKTGSIVVKKGWDVVSRERPES